MRFLIQSRASGKFLCPDLNGGEPVWVLDLREAGGGVFTDLSDAAQFVIDNGLFDDEPFVVDLDRLGTIDDYPLTV